MIALLSKKRIGSGFLFAIIFFLATSGTASAFTGTIHFDCTNLSASYGAAPGCVSSTWSFSGGSQGYYGNTDANSFIVSGQTIYLTYTLTGSGSMNVGGGSGATVLLTGSQTNYPFTPTATTAQTPYFSTDNGATMTVGTISNLCMSDSPTGCGGGGGGGGVATSTPYNCAQDASSTGCLVQVEDNPNLDYAMGVALFLFGLWFSIWLFRR